VVCDQSPDRVIRVQARRHRPGADAVNTQVPVVEILAASFERTGPLIAHIHYLQYQPHLAPSICYRALNCVFG
jgi:hypothetical protein